MNHVEDQAALLEGILRHASFTARREHLMAVWREVRWNFFPLLSEAVEEGRVVETDGLALCEGLLEASGALDLRDDWPRQQWLIIRGAAWFAQRRTEFSALVEDEGTQLLSYEKLQEWLARALQLAQSEERPEIGMAMLNVLLAAAPRAVSGVPPVSQEETLRYELTTGAAGVIISQKLGDYRTNGERLLSEAESLYTRIAAEEMDDFRHLTVELSALSRLYLAGDLARAGGDLEAAINIYLRALGKGEELAASAYARPELAAALPRLGLSVPNTLWRLANAEALAWRLDNADAHLRRAINEYQRLGESDQDLIPHLEALARVQFMRTNFEGAEELLRQVARAREEAEP
jgi:tetratricopeptide (TPR) repeat protein